MAYLIAYLAAALVFACADAIWLTLAGPALYKPIIGPLLAAKPDLKAAAAFYLLYIAGVVFLAVGPALKDGQWRTAVVNGLALGLVAYGTYDLTNQATLRIWATKLTLADMAWGGTMTAIAALAGFLAARRWS